MSLQPADQQRRREWLIVAILTLVGGLLRLQGFGRIGLNHFDEGVYAFSGLWVLNRAGLGGLDPEVIAYAPPGFPILIGLAYAVLGVSDVAAVLVAIACGVAMIPVAAWLGRRTFGPGAGAAAAGFAALSLAHVAFSRKALTDAPFLLTWFVAIGTAGRFLDRPGFLRALGLGLAVGVVQNVKYNGWVAGVVTIIAALGGLLGDPEARRPAAVTRTFGWGLFAAFVSALVYWPWFQFVEAHGGYADLIRHHRSYVGGLGSWRSHWHQQLGQVVALSGSNGWGVLSGCVALAAAGLAAYGRAGLSVDRSASRTRRGIALLCGAAVVGLALIPEIGWWIGLGLSPVLLVGRSAAGRVLAAWWIVLSAMTPLYYPYARLWLPLHGASWLYLAAVACALLQAPAAPSMRWPVFWTPRRVFAGVAVLASSILGDRLVGGPRLPVRFPLSTVFAPTDALKVVATEVNSPGVVPTDGPGVAVRVFGRRPLAFYLATRGRVPFGLVGGPDDIHRPPRAGEGWLLVDDAVDGPSSSDTGRTTFEDLGYTPVKSWQERPDGVTLLDQFPGAAYDARAATLSIRLLKPTLPSVSNPSAHVPLPGTGR